MIPGFGVAWCLTVVVGRLVRSSGRQREKDGRPDVAIHPRSVVGPRPPVGSANRTVIDSRTAFESGAAAPAGFGVHRGIAEGDVDPSVVALRRGSERARALRSVRGRGRGRGRSAPRLR